MSHSFKKLFQNYYDNKKLSPDQLNKLMSVQKNPFFSVQAFAAVFAFCTLAFLLYKNLDAKVPLAEKIAKEVIYNHLKAKPPEVITGEYNVINNALDKLPFKVVAEYDGSNVLTLKGARYCSVQSQIAAQLKLKNIKNKKILTLYQFRLTEKFKSLPSSFTYKKGKNIVKIWKNKKIGFALAE